MSNFLNYLRLFHDSGIVDGLAILIKEDGSYPYMTRDIPDGPAPKVILFNEKLYVDTGKYNTEGFRIYKENLGVYKHTSYGE